MNAASIYLYEPGGHMETIIGTILTALAAAVDAVTGVVILVGVALTILQTIRVGLSRRTFEEAIPGLRLQLGRWLSLSLELALAADILRSILAPTWNDIGQLAAIAALRTVLNYFLEKEIDRGATMRRAHVAA